MGFSALIAAPYGIVMSMRVSSCWPTGVSLTRRSSSAQGVVADMMLWNQATHFETLPSILCSNYNVKGFCPT